MNITDIDDKTIRKANELGVPLAEVTQKYIDAFHADLRTLNILPADVYPRATEHIPEMLRLISTLLDKGFAYEKDGLGLLQHRALQGLRPPGQYRPGQPEAGRGRVRCRRVRKGSGPGFRPLERAKSRASPPGRHPSAKGGPAGTSNARP